MNINEKFFTETGDVSFFLSFFPFDTTGNWEFSVGTSGLTERAIVFSGKSGRVYDEDGHFLCSYGSEDLVIEGLLGNDNYTIRADNALAKCAYKDRRSLNYIKFLSSGEDTPKILVSGRGSVLEDSSALFISTDFDVDDLWINQISHLFDDVTITSGYTGAEISGSVTDINTLYDFVFFGESLETGDISLSGQWTGVEANKVSLSASSFPSFGLAINTGIRTGQLYPSIVDQDLNYNLFEEQILLNTGSISGLSPTGEILIGYSGGSSDAPLISKYSYNHYLVNVPSGYANLSDEGRQLFLNFIIEIS